MPTPTPTAKTKTSTLFRGEIISHPEYLSHVLPVCPHRHTRWILSVVCNPQTSHLKVI